MNSIIGSMLMAFMSDGLYVTADKKLVISYQQSSEQTQAMLKKLAPTMSEPVSKSFVRALACAKENQLAHRHIFTVIDYSLPSSQKRLWVFDAKNEKLLFHTYVSHGLKSGTLSPEYFSNIVNGKTSSIGVYHTDRAYRGRYGAALKLHGLDEKFNDNAYQRFIVMHGSWYVSENFITKYGRAGRSWGCPTVSLDLVDKLVDTIKDQAFLFVYYPDNKWVSQSTFLNCKNRQALDIITKENKMVEEQRTPIIFADVNKNKKYEKNEPVVVMEAGHYKRVVNEKIPLNRMLRRQIQGKEYIALNNDEFKNLSSEQITNSTRLVIPIVKKKRGYFATEIQFVNYGKAKKVSLNGRSHYISYEKKPSVNLILSDRFVRWVGL